MRKLSRFLALSRPERRLFLGTVMALPLLSVALAALGVNRVRALLDRTRTIAPPAADLPAEAIAAVVDKAARRWLPQPSCLTRSLWLHWLLRRRGLPSELRVGVRLADGRLEAHAWVEHAGMPLNETAQVLDRYAAFEGGL